MWLVLVQVACFGLLVVIVVVVMVVVHGVGFVSFVENSDYLVCVVEIVKRSWMEKCGGNRGNFDGLVLAEDV